MTHQEIKSFIEGRISRLEERLDQARQSPLSVSRTTIARLEGRIDAMEEVLAILPGGAAELAVTPRRREEGFIS